jgi:fatty acid desaturase
MPTTIPFHEASRDLRAALARAVPREDLKALHATSGWRHALVALRQGAVLAAAVWAILAHGDRPWVWIPASVVIGFVIFSLSVLLHEVVHRAVFARRASPLNAVLGYLYGVPCGLAPSQFSRWHLDHHEWLGTEDNDPKRRFLTPKIVRRWFKALYMTPALFPIYFRAAARAGRGYEPGLRRRARLERLATTAFHLGAIAALGFGASWGLAAKLHLVPVFLVFPVAFTLNRLGQHYDVRPGDPAAWGTLMKQSPWLWDRVFLWSNYHLEHHYFPRVPFYRLPALRRALEPFLRERGIRARGYGGLLWDWFVRNRVPHTDWSASRGAPGAG